MKQKLKLYGKAAASLDALLIALACCPMIHEPLFLFQQSAVTYIVAFVLFGALYLFSAVTCFVGKQKLPLFDRISQIVYIPLLFGFFYVQSIPSEYLSSYRDVPVGLHVADIVMVLLSLLFTWYWFHNLTKHTAKGPKKI